MLTRNHSYFIAILVAVWLLYYVGLPRQLHLQHQDGPLPPSPHKPDGDKSTENPLDPNVLAHDEFETVTAEVEEHQWPGDSSPALADHESSQQSGDEGNQSAVEDIVEYGAESKEKNGDNGKSEDESDEKSGSSDVKGQLEEDHKTKEKGGEKAESEIEKVSENENKTHDIGPKKAETLKALCKNTTWKDGLWLQCHSWCGPDERSVCGGLNNARNRVQSCLRLAIDAGSGLVIPTVTTQRYFDNPLAFGDQSACSDVYFDVDYLEKQISRECPQLQLRRCGDMNGIDNVVQMDRRTYEDGNYHHGTFRAAVESTLKDFNLSHVSTKTPVALGFGDTFISYNYTQSEEASIRKDLFKALKFNQRLLDIGSSILDSPQLQGGFIGIHLRGENDWPLPFGTRDQQMDFYTEELKHLRGYQKEFKEVYVSCGDTGVIESFRERLKPLGYNVHDKWSLMANQPKVSEKLKDMEFDLAAIVEYQVLVEANLFLGVWMSTLSLLIAYARSADKPEDFYTTYVTPGSRRDGGHRIWEEAPSLMGDDTTKLLVVNAAPIGFDVMDAFP